MLCKNNKIIANYVKLLIDNSEALEYHLDNQRAAVTAIDNNIAKDAQIIFGYGAKILILYYFLILLDIRLKLSKSYANLCAA